MKILIIDRIKLFQQMIASELDKTEVEYLFTSSGTGALAMLKKEVLDLICLPLFLDDMEGLELCHTIREIEQYNNTPIILMTADNTPELMQKSLQAGVTDIFDKQNINALITFILGLSQEKLQLKGKVLYVEDSKSQRLWLLSILENQGLEVDSFASGEAAWAQFQVSTYDLVITDIVLEGSMSGISLSNYIRNSEGDKSNTPILALTAFDSNCRRIGLFSLGINEYLEKPVIAKEIIFRVKTMIERQQLLNALNIEKKHANRANQVKTKFLANMSHELRTPLHGILSFSNFGIKDSEELAVGEQKSSSYLKYFQRIHSSGERLLLLVNDLLDISKLDAGGLNLKYVKQDLCEVMRGCLAEQEMRIHDLKIKVHTILEEPCIGEFDVNYITQVLTNLLSNALKFTPDNQSIYIKICKETINNTPSLCFIISDEGVGIPEGELESVFDRFIQSSKTQTDLGGTGLGLAICDEIIKLHHGKIWAEHNKPEGAVFKFIIPV